MSWSTVCARNVNVKRKRVVAILALPALFVIAVWLVRALMVPIMVFQIYRFNFNNTRVISLQHARSSSPVVPFIFHRTLKSAASMRPDWRKPNRSCHRTHADFSFKVWTNDNSRDFIQQHYPSLLATFDSYAYDIQRADVIRYAALHHFGGVYVDMNVGCRKRTTFLRLLAFPAVLPLTDPVGLSNDVLFSAPGHPFFGFVLKQLPAWNHFYFSPYPTEMLSTGPLFLSWCYAQYVSQLQANVNSNSNANVNETAADVYILPPHLYSVSSVMPHAVFDHRTAGGSWQGLDAWVFKLVYEHFGETALAIVLLMLLLLVVRR